MVGDFKGTTSSQWRPELPKTQQDPGHRWATRWLHSYGVAVWLAWQWEEYLGAELCQKHLGWRCVFKEEAAFLKDFFCSGNKNSSCCWFQTLFDVQLEGTWSNLANEFRSLASHCIFPRNFQSEIRMMDSCQNLCLDCICVINEIRCPTIVRGYTIFKPLQTTTAVLSSQPRPKMTSP